LQKPGGGNVRSATDEEGGTSGWEHVQGEMSYTRAVETVGRNVHRSQCLVVERRVFRHSFPIHVVLHCYEWFCRRLVTKQTYHVDNERQEVGEYDRSVSSVNS